MCILNLGNLKCQEEVFLNLTTMRKRISTNLRWVRFISIPVFISLAYSLVNLISKENTEIEVLIGLSFATLVCIASYFVFDSAKTVEFNETHLFITSKKGEERIPLKNIHGIKLTSYEINNRNMWKIKFTNRSNSYDSVKILPIYNDNSFEQFKQTVYQANPNVSIQKWTHSFDFDQ